jgi:hypothetical protein
MNINILIGALLWGFGVWFIIRFFAVTRNPAEGSEDVVIENDRKMLLAKARQIYPDDPLSKGLEHLYGEYRFTLRLSRKLRASDPKRQVIIDVCIRRLIILGEEIARATMDEAEERINAAERDSSFMTLPPFKPAA